MIALGEAHAAAIREHGRATYPEECCGVLLGGAREGEAHVVAVLPIDNIRADNRERRFLISPRDYLAAERTAQERGLDLLGFYHSHPDHPAIPSDFDRQHAWPNLHYVIVAVAKGQPAELTSWQLSEDRTTMLGEPVLLAAAAVR
jgi:proteasome lid subunit RPN8/RPN11